MVDVIAEIGPLSKQLKEIRGLDNKNRDGGFIEEWPVFNSSIGEYQRQFEPVLHGKKITEFIAAKPSPVVVDLLAPTGTIAELLSQFPNKPKFGLAVSRDDIREEEEKRRDEKLNIQLVAGDITTIDTWKKINEALNGRKADLVLERAVGGLKFLPLNKQFYYHSLGQIWQMLNEDDGMAVVETVSEERLQSLGIDLQEWTSLLSLQGISAEYAPNSNVYQKELVSGALKISRSKESPFYLPPF